MDDSPSKRVALLAIKPRFAAEILAGRKRVEFRKRPFAEAVTHVILYATSPVKQVVGFFEVAHTDTGEPRALWNRYCRVGAIGRDEFETYYRTLEHGTAIGVGRAWALEQPVPLDAVGATVPPQSYSYLPGEAITLLRGSATREVCWSNVQLTANDGATPRGSSGAAAVEVPCDCMQTEGSRILFPDAKAC